MKQLYFILAALAILAGCQPQEEVIKSHGIKEVHLVQFRYYYPQDSIEDYVYTEGDILKHKVKLVGYTSLKPQSGNMEVWSGFYTDSISRHPYEYAPKIALATALANFAALAGDRFYYHDWENPDYFGGSYCGPNLFFQIVRDDGANYTIGFTPSKLPEELEGLYRAMDYNAWELTEGQRVVDASSTKKATFLHTIDSIITGKEALPPPLLPPPPPPVMVPAKHLTPAIED